MSLQSAIEQTVAQEFNFEILKQPLFSPDMAKTPVYGLFRSDNRKFVGSQSWTEKYVPHKVEDVSALVEAAGTLFDNKFSIKCLWRDGHYVFIQPTEEIRRNIFGTKDAIFPRLIIKAGYNGRAFSATMGAYRDACKNLHIMRSVSSATTVIRHTNSLRSKMDYLIADFQRLGNSFDSVTEAVKQMESNRKRVSSFLAQVLGEMPVEDGAKKTRYVNRMEDIVSRMMRERIALGRYDDGTTATGWELYNAVQGYVQHDKTRRGTVNQWDRVLLASNDPMVVKAEQLALSV